MIPAQERNEYFPIYFSGPRPADKTSSDTTSVPSRSDWKRSARHATAERRWLADASLSFRTRPTRAGFLVCLPVYEKGKPVKNVADRRKYLLGFVLGVFRPSDMLDAARPLKPEGIDVCLYDPSSLASGQPLDFHASRTREDRSKPIDPSRLDDSRGHALPSQARRGRASLDDRLPADAPIRRLAKSLVALGRHGDRAGVYRRAWPTTCR